MQLNKTQIKKINQARTWFEKGDKFTIDEAIKRFNTKFAKDDVLTAYYILHKSFKNHSNFLKVKSFYETAELDICDNQRDFIKLAKLLKQFVKSFN